MSIFYFKEYNFKLYLQKSYTKPFQLKAQKKSKRGNSIFEENYQIDKYFICCINLKCFLILLLVSI